MAKIKTYSIWSNIGIKLEDWKEFLDDYEKNCFNRAFEEGVEFDESFRYYAINDYLDQSLDDERMNLDIQLNNPILVIADLGLWNGRVLAYKIIESGNIKDIFYSNMGDYSEWYSDGRNILGTEIHHDGTNHYEYREIKDMETIHNLTDKLYRWEKVDRKLITRYTKSILPSVKKVYGW